MKEPFESGFTAYRLFDLPNFVQEKESDSVVFVSGSQ
jgi:hypothetical protein